MLGIAMILAIIIEIAIPIGTVILLILGIKALAKYLYTGKLERMEAEEIYRTNKELDNIEAEINQKNET